MKKTFFYGYVIVFTCFILQLIMLGPRSSFGVFIKPITSELDWPRALISGGFSVSVVLQGFFAIIMGWLNDKLGTRVVLTVCGILIGSGLMLMYFIDSAWQFYLCYGLLVGPGMGGIYAPQMSTVARWFVKRRNIMSGIVMVGGGMGGLIGPPLITWLIYTHNWREAFLFIGIGAFFLIILFAQFLRRDPSQMGQIPYGEVSETKENVASNALRLSLKQAFYTTKFWLISLIMFCAGFCCMTIMVHIVPFAIDRGISPATAAVILSISNGTMPVGNIVVGLVADKIGSRRAFITCVFLLSSIMLFLLPVNSAWILSIFLIVLSFGAGGIAVILSSLVAELFGMKSHGTILGCIYFIFTLGGSAGPFIGGSIFDNTGSYQSVFLLCGFLVVLAIILALFLNRIRKTEAVI
jgi:MFS family permease